MGVPASRPSRGSLPAKLSLGGKARPERSTAAPSHCAMPTACSGSSAVGRTTGGSGRPVPDHERPVLRVPVGPDAGRFPAGRTRPERRSAGPRHPKGRSAAEDGEAVDAGRRGGYAPRWRRAGDGEARRSRAAGGLVTAGRRGFEGGAQRPLASPLVYTRGRLAHHNYRCDEPASVVLRSSPHRLTRRRLRCPARCPSPLIPYSP